MTFGEFMARLGDMAKSVVLISWRDEDEYSYFRKSKTGFVFKDLGVNKILIKADDEVRVGNELMVNGLFIYLNPAKMNLKE